MQAEHLAQALEVLHAADFRVEAQSREALAHAALQVEEPAFGNFEGDESGGLETRDLGAKLAADGAGGAGHHRYLAAQTVADAPPVELDRLTAQNIFDGHLADLT